MQPTWLIESGVYRSEAGPLLAEIRRQGMTAELVPYAALKQGTAPIVGGQSLGDGAFAIGYGTFAFARQIQLHHRWTPGAWCNPATLDCATYYAYFGRHLLNEHYAILPGVEAIRQADWLFDTFARDGSRVFVRPTACDKLFVGRAVARVPKWCKKTRPRRRRNDLRPLFSPLATEKRPRNWFESKKKKTCVLLCLNPPAQLGVWLTYYWYHGDLQITKDGDAGCLLPGRPVPS